MVNPDDSRVADKLREGAGLMGQGAERMEFLIKEAKEAQADAEALRGELQLIEGVHAQERKEFADDFAAALRVSLAAGVSPEAMREALQTTTAKSLLFSVETGTGALVNWEPKVPKEDLGPGAAF
jgi:hypothetical protein